MLIIRGVEVTQAIQYFRSDQHLHKPEAQGPDNSLTLIANKPAWVRVYVESDTPGTDIPNVTGKLEINYGFLNQNVGPSGMRLNPHPSGATVTAKYLPHYGDVRGSTSRTLNFIIPEHWMIGPLILNTTVTDGAAHTAVQTTFISPVLRQTLKLRGIMIAYQSRDRTVTFAAPGLDEFQAMAGAAIVVLPVRAGGVFEIASTLTRSSAISATTTYGPCHDGWLMLNSAVLAARIADGNHPGYLYYGLVAARFPRNSGTQGCATGGVASGVIESPITMIHELGHLCGRQHAPIGGAERPDSLYPDYVPYPRGSIGEFGLFMTNGIVLSPQSTFDYMGYPLRPWISIYGHKALINIPELNPEIVGLRRAGLREWRDYYPRDPWWPRPEPWGPEVRLQKVITVIGLIDAEDRVEVLSVTRSEVLSTQIKGITTDLRVVLHGPKRAELASGVIFELPSLGMCGCGGGAAQPRPTMFQAFVPDVAMGTELSIRQKGKTRWKRLAPAGAISVGAPKIACVKDAKWEVTWTAKVPGGAKDTWVRVSADEGKSWRAVATGLTEKRVSFEALHAPAGKLLLDVLVHDGFHSVSSKPVAFENAVLPPVPAIMHPQNGQILVEGETLCLWGSVAGQPGGAFDDLKYSWSVDGHPAGEVPRVFTSVPEPGPHRCEFTVRSAAGEALASCSVEFVSLSLDESEKL
jgi:hypothetical protein